MKNEKVLILLNDPDKLLVRVFRNKFEAIKMSPIITDNYDEALAIIEEKKPILFITEIILNDPKGRTGFDLIEEIRSNRKYDDMEIAIFTELAQEEDTKRAGDLGIGHYFTKNDVTINEVVTKVQVIINSYQIK